MKSRCYLRSNDYLKIGGIVLFSILCVLLALPAQAQQLFVGESDRVMLIPNGRTDAGMVQLFIDSDRDGISDDFETAKGSIPKILWPQHRTPMAMG